MAMAVPTRRYVYDKHSPVRRARDKTPGALKHMRRYAHPLNALKSDAQQPSW